MADEDGNSGSDHQCGAENREEALADRLGEQDVPRWIRPAIWGVAPVVVMLLYFIALPALIIFLENKDLLPYGSKIDVFYEVAFGPLTWLYENAELYKDYLEWLDRMVSWTLETLPTRRHI